MLSFESVTFHTGKTKMTQARRVSYRPHIVEEEQNLQRERRPRQKIDLWPIASHYCFATKKDRCAFLKRVERMPGLFLKMPSRLVQLSAEIYPEYARWPRVGESLLRSIK
jgi:hypothetical protein